MKMPHYKRTAFIVLIAIILSPTLAQATGSSGNYSAVTVGTSSAQILAANQANVFVDIHNDSSTATIACALGTTAVINGSGSITIPPLWHKAWNTGYVPRDAINCIASASSTPVTLGYR